MKSSINTAYGIMIDHSPAIAENVPTEGLAAAIATAIDAERERCAKIAEKWAGDIEDDGSLVPAPEGIAAAIRNQST